MDANIFKTTLLLCTLYIYKRGQMNQYFLNLFDQFFKFWKIVQLVQHTKIHHSVGHIPNDRLNLFQLSKNKDWLSFAV